MTTVFQQFLDRYVRDHYQRARMTYVAIDRGTFLQVIAGRVVFELASQQERPAFETHVDSFSVRVANVEASGVIEAITSSDGRSIRFGDVLLDMGTERDAFTWDISLDPVHNHSATGWPSVILHGMGQSMFNALAPFRLGSVDRLWSAAQPVPLGAWNEIAQLIGPKWEFYDQRAVGFDLVAPRYCRIESAEAGASTGMLSVRLRSIPNPPDPDLAVVIRRERSPGGGERIAAETWKRDGNNWIVTSPIARDSGWIEVRLSGRDGMLDFTRVPSPGLAGEVLSHFDPEDKWLRGMLGGDGAKSKRDLFETGIATLLGLCRIPVIPFGVRSPTDAVDLVGIAGPNQLIVAECTTVTPTPDKIAHLHARTAELHGTLKNRMGLIITSALFFSTQENSVVKAAEELASQHGIALVGRDRLVELRAAGLRGEGPEYLVDLLNNWA